MKNVRLIKAIPEKRLNLITGDATRRPVVGDLGESDHCYTGPWGQMVLVYFHSEDGETEWEAEAYWRELESSIATDVDIEALFDATALHRSGECPWTIFAYPTDIARTNGLPPDHDVQMILAELQKRGIPMAIWVNGIEENTTYLACRCEDRPRVDQAITDLENQGILEKNFLADRSTRLFALGESST
jgi:hypothetical protein